MSRRTPFEPPTGDATDAIELVEYPTGIQAWLVRSLEGAREVLADPDRFRACGGAAHVLPQFPLGRPVGPQDLERMDGEEHRRFRRHLSSDLSSSRAAGRHEGWISDVINRHVDELTSSAPPVDFHDGFSRPLLAEISTTFLGLPVDLAKTFHRQAVLVSSGTTTQEELKEVAFTCQLALRRALRTIGRSGRDGLLHRLAARTGKDAMTEEELLGVISGTLMGHYMVANMATYALFLFLSKPAQWNALCADPGLAGHAAEEAVRLLAIPEGTLRQATRDTTIGDHRIAEGDLLVAANASANRDPGLCPFPGEVDVSRLPGPHLGYGHGPHYCIGHRFARVELTEIVRTLARRVPSLRLAGDISTVRLREKTTMGGPEHLPVTWTQVRDRAPAGEGGR
jgi:cytochrome P450